MLDPKKQVLEGAFQTFSGGGKMLTDIRETFLELLKLDRKAPQHQLCVSVVQIGPGDRCLWPFLLHFISWICQEALP